MLLSQVRGRALKKEEQEQVDIAQRVLDVLKSDKDVRCGPSGAPAHTQKHGQALRKCRSSPDMQPAFDQSQQLQQTACTLPRTPGCGFVKPCYACMPGM